MFDRNGAIAAFARFSGYVAGVGLLVAALAITLDVTLRWLFSSPIKGLFELSELAFAAIVALAFAYANETRTHISLDLANTVSRHTRGLQALGSLLTGLAFAGFVALLWIYAGAKTGYGETTLVLGLPIGPFWYAITVLIAISFIAQLPAIYDDVFALVHSPAGNRLREWIPVVVVVLVCVAILLALTAFQAQTGPLTKLCLGFVALYVLALARVPLGIALAITGFAGTWVLLAETPARLIVTNSLTSSLPNADLAALPLFLLMGNLAISAGFADDIFQAASAVFGRLRGGHAIAAIMGCAGFGAISGSSLATTATIGKAAFREMKTRGYATSLSTGSIAAGGTLGALVPPSIVLIIYCVIAEQSIAEAFAAALIPALIATLLYVGAIIIATRLSPALAPASDHDQRFAPMQALRSAWRPTLLFTCVLGGLYGGVFTAQEAAAVGAGLAFVFWLASGKASVRGLMNATRDAVTMSARLYLILIGAGVFGSFLNLSGAPGAIMNLIDPNVLPVWLVLTLLVVMYLVLGSVFDTVAALVITVPFVIPIIIAMDGNLVWWGVVTLSLVEIGMITPPIGMNVFVLKGVLGDDVSIATIFRGVVPFLMADLLRIVVLIAFPALSLWLPSIL